jgi:hypothetical protein
MTERQADFDGYFFEYATANQPTTAPTEWARPSVVDGIRTDKRVTIRAAVSEALIWTLQELNTGRSVDVYGHVRIAHAGTPNESTIAFLHQLTNFAVSECDHEHIMLSGLSKKAKTLAKASEFVVSTAVTQLCSQIGNLARVAGQVLRPVGVCLNFGDLCGEMPMAEQGMDVVEPDGPTCNALAIAVVAKLTEVDDDGSLVIQTATFHNHNDTPKGGILSEVVSLCGQAKYDALMPCETGLSLRSFTLWLRACSHQLFLMTRASLLVPSRVCVCVCVCVYCPTCAPHAVVCTHHHDVVTYASIHLLCFSHHVILPHGTAAAHARHRRSCIGKSLFASGSHVKSRTTKSKGRHISNTACQYR